MLFRVTPREMETTRDPACKTISGFSDDAKGTNNVTFFKKNKRKREEALESHYRASLTTVPTQEDGCYAHEGNKKQCVADSEFGTSEGYKERVSIMPERKDAAWHLQTRKHLFKESLSVMTDNVPEYELILKSSTPTDPRGVEVGTDEQHQQNETYAEYREAPFARSSRWPGGLTTFLFVAVAETFTLGIINPSIVFFVVTL